MASTLAKSRALNFLLVEHSQKGRDIVRTHNHGASQPFFSSRSGTFRLALGGRYRRCPEMVITGLMLLVQQISILSWPITDVTRYSLTLSRVRSENEIGCYYPEKNSRTQESVSARWRSSSK